MKKIIVILVLFSLTSCYYVIPQRKDYLLGIDWFDEEARIIHLISYERDSVQNFHYFVDSAYLGKNLEGALLLGKIIKHYPERYYCILVNDKTTSPCYVWSGDGIKYLPWITDEIAKFSFMHHVNTQCSKPIRLFPDYGYYFAINAPPINGQTLYLWTHPQWSRSRREHSQKQSLPFYTVVCGFLNPLYFGNSIMRDSEFSKIMIKIFPAQNLENI